MHRRPHGGPAIHPLGRAVFATHVLPLIALAAPAAASPLLLAWGSVQAAFTWALLRPRGRLLGPNLERAEGDPARVALTFDDGPRDGETGALLDLLAAAGARATFFPVGTRARAGPRLLRRMIAEGHAVGNHTETHPLMWAALGRRRVMAEVGNAQATLADLTGTAPRWFRPPMGHKNMYLAETLERHALRQVTWSLRSYDTLLPDPERVGRRVMRRVRAGDIVLLHEGLRSRGAPGTRDGRDGRRGPDSRTVLGLRPVLEGLAAKGLRAVTLDALLDGPFPAAAAGPQGEATAPGGRRVVD